MTSMFKVDQCTSYQDYAANAERPLQDQAPPPVACSLSKRAFDVAIAGVTLLFLAPLLLLVAVCIKLDSAGPVLFVQHRTGLGGRKFKVFKFRTMTVMEDGDRVRQATRDDQRVTRIGALLRRSSVDELPQLFNVLRGEMSLVGPRPHALAHDEMFGRMIVGYHARFRATPGITGLAQVRGLRGEIVDLHQLQARIDADNEYIDRWSLRSDLWIMLKTALVLPLQRNAY